MGYLITAFGISLFLNLILWRWAVSERRHRLEWEEEAVSLRRMVRAYAKGDSHGSVRLGWLGLAILVVFLVLFFIFLLGV